MTRRSLILALSVAQIIAISCFSSISGSSVDLDDPFAAIVNIGNNSSDSQLANTADQSEDTQSVSRPEYDIPPEEKYTVEPEDVSSNQGINSPEINLDPEASIAGYDGLHEVPSGLTGDYEEAEFDKYNSPASENGLANTPIWIEGVLSNLESITSDYGLIYTAVVTVADGQWIITLDAKTLMEWTGNDNVEMLQAMQGHDVVVCGLYQGYSSLYEMPSLVTTVLFDRKSGVLHNTVMGSIQENSPSRDEENVMAVGAAGISSGLIVPEDSDGNEESPILIGQKDKVTEVNSHVADFESFKMNVPNSWGDYSDQSNDQSEMFNYDLGEDLVIVYYAHNPYDNPETVTDITPVYLSAFRKSFDYIEEKESRMLSLPSDGRDVTFYKCDINHNGNSYPMSLYFFMDNDSHCIILAYIDLDGNSDHLQEVHECINSVVVYGNSAVGIKNLDSERNTCDFGGFRMSVPKSWGELKHDIDDEADAYYYYPDDDAMIVIKTDLVKYDGLVNEDDRLQFLEGLKDIFQDDNATDCRIVTLNSGSDHALFVRHDRDVSNLADVNCTFYYFFDIYGRCVTIYYSDLYKNSNLLAEFHDSIKSITLTENQKEEMKDKLLYATESSLAPQGELDKDTFTNNRDTLIYKDDVSTTEAGDEKYDVYYVAGQRFLLPSYYMISIEEGVGLLITSDDYICHGAIGLVQLPENITTDDIDYLRKNFSGVLEIIARNEFADFFEQSGYTSASFEEYPIRGYPGFLTLSEGTGKETGWLLKMAFYLIPENSALYYYIIHYPKTMDNSILVQDFYKTINTIPQG